MPSSGHAPRLGALVLAAVALGETLTAQDRSCRLAVHVTGEGGVPLPDAGVSAAGVSARTDSAGHATLAAVPAGDLALRVRRVGHVPQVRTVAAHCGAGAATPVTIAMAPAPQLLAPVVVRADDRPRYAGPMAQFWERRAKGEGFFFTASEIDRRNVQKMADLIRTVPGWSRNQTQRTSDAIVRGTAIKMGVAQRDPMRGSGPATCYPTVVIDGMAATASELALDGIDPRSLSGVEVYTDGSRTPAEFWGTAGQGRCGVVAVWSRSLDAMRHTPLEQQRVMADTVYEPHEVDRFATLDQGVSLPVLYPRELRRKRASGEATVSVVVLPTGEPWLREAKVVSATHEEFGKALLDAVPTLRFAPAERDGRAVAQRAVVRISFTHPD